MLNITGRACIPQIEPTATRFEIAGDYIVPKIDINPEHFSFWMNITHASMDYELLPAVMYFRDKKKDIDELCREVMG